MKKGLLALSIITLALINFASAYNGFIGDALDAIGMENLFLVIIFLGSFTLSYIPLSRIWKQNTGAAGVIAFLVGLGITAGINYYGWDVEGLIYGLGFDEEIIVPIAFLALTIFAIFLIWKKGLGVLFMALGALLLVLSYWAYEKSILVGTGAILLFLGIVFWWRRRRRKQNQGLESDYSGRGRFAEFDRKVGGGIARGIGAGLKPLKWAGRKIKSETIAKDREMSKRKAHKAALKENEERDERQRRMASEMQREYNRLKQQFSSAERSGDRIAMKNLADSIAHLTNQARQYKINLRY